MKKIQLAAASVLAFAFPAMAQQMSAEDFVATAASSDLFEIQSSELVQESGEADAVKDFAQMMIADHTNASQELQAAASSAGIEVPTEMNEKHASQLESLEGLEGAELDAAYVEAQVAAHEEALALMEGYAGSGEEEALRAHSEKTAPIIATHLEHVQQLANQ